MKNIKKILIPLVVLSSINANLFAVEEHEVFAVENVKKEKDFSFWDVVKDPFSKETLDDALDEIEDKLPNITKIDEVLFDISNNLNIDKKERELVDKIEDKLPDSIVTDMATYAIKAGSDVIRATLITDKEMDLIGAKDIAKMDDDQTLAKDVDQYYIDLKKIMKKIPVPDDIKLDVKVYDNVHFLYIFTRSNGSIRVNSAMLERFDDDEMLFLMAHEIAHIINKDYKESYRKAHSMYALENTLNMTGDNTIGSSANGLLESVTSRMRKARFQKDEEFEADDFAMKVLKMNGVGKKAAVDCLEKLQYLNAPLLMMHPTGYERVKNIKDNY
jgi:metalloprotease